MKTMTCQQLGGACDREFHAATFEEIANMSKQHGMDMLEKKDPAHMQAMHTMQQLMQKPEDMDTWMKEKQEEFEQAPETS